MRTSIEHCICSFLPEFKVFFIHKTIYYRAQDASCIKCPNISTRLDINYYDLKFKSMGFGIIKASV